MKGSLSGLRSGRKFLYSLWGAAVSHGPGDEPSLQSPPPRLSLQENQGGLSSLQTSGFSWEDLRAVIAIELNDLT